MAIGIEPESATEPGVADEVMFGGALNEPDQAAMRFSQLRANLGQRQAPFLVRHSSVEGVEASELYGVPWRRAALQDEQEVLQRLLFPCCHVREDIADRPGAGDTRLRQQRIREIGVRLVERLPGLG